MSYAYDLNVKLTADEQAEELEEKRSEYVEQRLTESLKDRLKTMTCIEHGEVMDWLDEHDYANDQYMIALRESDAINAQFWFFNAFCNVMKDEAVAMLEMEFDHEN